MSEHHSSSADIVERLRDYAKCSDADIDEAANEIERLRADIAVKAIILTKQTKEIDRLRAPAQPRQEPVAWTNEAQLSFMKYPDYAEVPMAMWAKPSRAAPIPLYYGAPSSTTADDTKRITGATDIVDEAACLIWDELCPGIVMGDEDRLHYENAAKAVLALSSTQHSCRNYPGVFCPSMECQFECQEGVRVTLALSSQQGNTP